MKRLLIIAATVACSISASAQCAPPECENNFELNGSYSNAYVTDFNTNAIGVVCFSGGSSLNVLPPTFDVSKITSYVFEQSDTRYQVNKIINLSGKVYVPAETRVTFADITFVGGSMYVEGTLEITKLNTSTAGIIALVGSGTVRINGTLYPANTTVGNVRIVSGCSTALPIRFGKIKIERL